MRAQLDRTEQRVLGVLAEKELSVPETYPLTLNSLLAGCNQKSNRDPPMELEEFEVEGATISLCLKDWAARREGSRAVKFVHRLEARLGVSQAEKAILAELLVRGPQTPMELKARVARMGVHQDAAAITATLEAMARRPDGPLVELMARRPRERDVRWRHLLGPMATEHTEAGEAAADERPATPAGASRLDALEARIAELERKLAELLAR